MTYTFLKNAFIYHILNKYIEIILTVYHSIHNLTIRSTVYGN